MKVIIELNDDITIENVEMCPNEVKVNIKIAGKTSSWAIVNIEELKLALRKLITK
jgi:hypothetical protein